jgi:hypothetical protein
MSLWGCWKSSFEVDPAEVENTFAPDRDAAPTNLGFRRSRVPAWIVGLKRTPLRTSPAVLVALSVKKSA